MSIPQVVDSRAILSQARQGRLIGQGPEESIDATGLDVHPLKPQYGDRLTFWGNIDARKMSGPADVLEAEIRDKITVAGQGGGHMYHSDHSVPAEVSFSHYRWIMELVEKYGIYD